MQAVLLAAGFATRLYPLTRDLAKPLLGVGGRPVIAWLLDEVLRLEGLSEVLVVTNARFHAQFVEWAAAYPSPVPVRVVDDGALDEATKLGAIGDLRLALAHLPDDGAPFFVGAADNLARVDLEGYRRRFLENPERGLLLVREIRGQVPPGRYSEVLLDSGGGVRRFREKPADPESNLSAVGLYFLPAAARGWIDEYLAAGGNPDAPGYLFEWLSQEHGLAATRLEGDWHDIGNHETLAAARAAYGS